MNVALLHPPGTGGQKTLLHKAIDRLGARAVSIGFSEDERVGGIRDIAAMARILGRLYDAVDCAGMKPPIVQSIAQAAGVPVFGGLGCERHPVKALGELWTIEQALDDVPGKQRIRFIGDPKAEPASAFMTAADRLGFGIEMNGQGVAAAPFTVDASDPCRWKLRKGATPVSQALRLDNRTCVIQALLLQEISGR